MHCNKCNQDKPPEAFYRTNRARCKLCVAACATANRLANPERAKAYEKARGSQPHRVAARAAYAETPAYAASHKTSVAKWKSGNLGRRKANEAVNNAVRDGKLVPWPVCAIHTCDSRPHGHHPDYSRPLEVVWLCPLHHKQAHAIVEAENFLPA